MLLPFFLNAVVGLLALGALTQPTAGAALRRRIVPRSHTLHERQSHRVSSQWVRRDKVAQEALLPVRIGLKQLNLDDGHAMLMEISDHLSPKYGKHMTAEEVIEFFAPEKSRVDTIVNWLTKAGIAADRVTLSKNKQWVQFDAAASELESVLYTDFYHYEHPQTGSTGIACEAYHVPDDISEHIDYITPGIRLRRDPRKVRDLQRRTQGQAEKRGKVTAAHTSKTAISNAVRLAATSETSPFNSSVCDTYVSQVCIRNQYDIPKGTTAYPGNELGIFETLNDHVSIDDLDYYWSVLYPDIPQGTYPDERLIDGAIGYATDSSEIGLESALDFQAAMPLIYPQQAVLFQTDDEYYEISQSTSDTYSGFWNTFYDAIDGSYCTYSAFNETGNCKTDACRDPVYPNPYGYNKKLMCGVYKPTNVISISYGGDEGDEDQANYLKRQCSEIMKLGLQGVTVVISSGDHGVGDTYGCVGPDYETFNPQRDAVCPYVLAVGSTVIKAGNSSGQFVETATTSFASGGGFSNLFPIPQYQASAVEAYLNNASLSFSGYSNFTSFDNVTSGVFNLGGRGYPDVSAVGDNFVTAYEGGLYLVGGTSLSAPVWASILTRINEERLKANKSTIGFVNPTLVSIACNIHRTSAPRTNFQYANPHVLTDITIGSNPNSICGTDGFVAAEGWDPVSGLGTPKYPELLSLFMSLP